MIRDFGWKIYVILVSAVMLAACDVNDGLEEGKKRMINSEKEVLFKMILDHPDLQQYLHPDLAQRVPLKVKSNNELGVDLSIEKFAKPVLFIEAIGSTENTPMLEVVLFEAGDGQVSFKILYAIEGVTIKGVLDKSSGQWLFKEFVVFES